MLRGGLKKIQHLPPGQALQLALMAALALTAYWYARYFSVVIFRSYPFTHDEYVNNYQARIFAAGRMMLHINEMFEPMIEVFMISYNDYIFSKYPPGFSAILAIGALLGKANLVNPFITAVSSCVIFVLLRRMFSVLVAACTVLLLVLNSYFLGFGGSYFPQPLTLLIAAFVFYFYQRHEADGRRRNLFAAAFVIGLCFLVRPLDAFCLLLTFCTALLFEPGRTRIRCITDIACFGTAGSCGLLVLMLYNYWLVECFCVAVYPIWDSEFKIVEPTALSWQENLLHVAMQYADSLLPYFQLNLIEKFIPIIGPMFLFFALAGVFATPNTLCCASVLYIIVQVLFYNFHQQVGVFIANAGWPQYGTRYWYPLIVPLCVLAANGLRFALKKLPLYAFAALVVFTLTLQITRINSDAADYKQRFDDVLRIKYAFEKRCPGKAVAILFPHEWYFYLNKKEFITVDDFKRNMFMTGPLYYVNTLNEAIWFIQRRRDYHVCQFFLHEHIMDNWHKEK